MYYAVAGSNGFGIYDNESKMKNVIDYVYNASINKCSSLGSAFSYASNYYNSYQADAGVDAIVDCWNCSDISINRIYFKREIVEINREKNPLLWC